MNLKTYTFDDNVEIKYEDVENNRLFVQKDIEKLFLKYGNFYKSTESEKISLQNVLIQMYDANFNFPDNVVNFFKKSITECDNNNGRCHYLKHPTEGILVFTNDLVARFTKKYSMFFPIKFLMNNKKLPPSAEIVYVVIKNENDKFKLIKGAYFGENELIKTRTEEEITFFPEGWYEVNECNSEGWSKIDKKIYGWQRLSMLDYNDFESGEPNDLTKN